MSYKIWQYLACGPKNHTIKFVSLVFKYPIFNVRQCGCDTCVGRNFYTVNGHVEIFLPESPAIDVCFYLAEVVGEIFGEPDLVADFYALVDLPVAGIGVVLHHADTGHIVIVWFIVVVACPKGDKQECQCVC